MWICSRRSRTLDLVEAVASIQLAIRLLLPAGSRLMELPEIRALAGSLDPTALAHAWQHPDPRVDQLQRDVQRLVGRKLHAPRAAVFDEVMALALAAAGQRARDTDRPRARACDRALSDRALVLLSGAHRRAGCSSLN